MALNVHLSPKPPRSNSRLSNMGWIWKTAIHRVPLGQCLGQRSSWVPVPGFSSRTLSSSRDPCFICQSFCYCEACSMYVYKRASLQTTVYMYDCMHGRLKTNIRFTLVRRPNCSETRESFAWTPLKNQEENVHPSAQRSKALRWL